MLDKPYRQAVFRSFCRLALAALLVFCFASVLVLHSSTAAVAQSGAGLQSGGDTAGTVRVANLEAMLNIVANAVEQLQSFEVASLFAGAIVAFVRRRPRIGTFLLVMCPVYAVIGSATPGTINWAVATARDANLFNDRHEIWLTASVWLFILLISSFYLAMDFIPAFLAFKFKHSLRWAIFAATFVRWAIFIFAATFVAWLIPFGWSALLLWSFYDPKTDAVAPSN